MEINISIPRRGGLKSLGVLTLGEIGLTTGARAQTAPSTIPTDFTSVSPNSVVGPRVQELTDLREALKVADSSRHRVALVYASWARLHPCLPMVRFWHRIGLYGQRSKVKPLKTSVYADAVRGYFLNEQHELY